MNDFCHHVLHRPPARLECSDKSPQTNFSSCRGVLLLHRALVLSVAKEMRMKIAESRFKMHLKREL